MMQLQRGYDQYDNVAPSVTCTGDAKIDRILEIANMRAESAMEDHNVYTWAGFCQTLRLFTPSNDNGSTTTGAPVTTTTAAPAPVTTTTAAPAPSGQCGGLSRVDGMKCGGTDWHEQE